MSNTQNLADQLGWCNTTRHYLEDLEDDIRHVARQYYQTLDQLHGDQYLMELFNKLVPICEEFNKRAEGTVRHIDDAHIDYVNQQSDSISEQLQAILNLPSQNF